MLERWRAPVPKLYVQEQSAENMFGVNSAVMTESGEELKLVGGGGFLGIEEFSVFKYAFLNSSVGIGVDTLPIR